MTNQALLDYVAHMTYIVIASGAEPPKFRKILKKSDLAISYEESPSKKKSTKSKKVAATKPKPTKKKAPIKANRGNGLNVLSEVALSEAARLKKATKRSKKDFHISQASVLGDGTDIELGFPNDGEEDKDDENDSEDKSDNDDDDANDDDNQEGDDTNDDDKETDSDRTKSDIINILVLNQSNNEYYEEEEENTDDEETMDKEEDDEVTKELYKDVNVNLGNKDADMNDADQGGAYQQNASQQSRLSKKRKMLIKLLNLENVSPDVKEIASLIDTATIPPPPPFFNPLSQQATPTPTPTTSEATTIVPTLPDFASEFIFNDRVTNLERDLFQLKQVDQYAQAISLIPAIMDRYMDNKLDEAIHKAIQEEVKTQLPKILPKAVLAFATLVIERNVTESLEAAILARANYKKELYDVLVKSYKIEKDLFNIYGEVFTMKMSRDDKDKDQDPSARSDRGKKRRKSSKEAKSSIDLRFATNMSSSKDVYSKKRIITVTRLTIMKKYDYDYLEEIDVRQDDQKLYKFKEGNKDGISAKKEMEWFNKRMAQVMVQDIKKQLYERRLMCNLEKFIGGREYGNDLRLLERTI
uniref:Uncharacterized protein n=1 Tax=Tanacetum cinerariifolium TaxID=118510 RepID=A0A6L2LYJ6_TANCI|nr:hypothetical protein [Tanacetum cinerariifolium]